MINQIIDDPDKLKLGGEKKHMTAIFTDVRGFSTFSEQLDPTDLVKLLNEYLTEMSDIVLDQAAPSTSTRGTPSSPSSARRSRWRTTPGGPA